jgi:hypothetical protein
LKEEVERRVGWCFYAIGFKFRDAIWRSWEFSADGMRKRTAIIGKMAPAICLGLYHYTKSPFVIGWFMFIISLATILAIAWPYNDKAKI